MSPAWFLQPLQGEAALNGRCAPGHTVLCPLQATLNPHPELFLGLRVWLWGSPYWERTGGAAACLIQKHMGRRGGLTAPRATGQSRQGKESRVEVEGRGPGLRRRWAGGGGRSPHKARDSPESSRALFGSSAHRDPLTRPKGALALSRSLLNGWMNESERGWGRGGGSG